MAKRQGFFHGLTQAIEGATHRFDARLLQQLENGLCVTSRNCCLNHCLGPFISILDKREAFARAHENGRAKLSLETTNCQYARQRRLGRRRLEGLDDAAAQHRLVLIEDGGLPRAHRTLRLMKMNAHRRRTDWLESRRNCRGGIADLYMDVRLRGDQCGVKQIKVGNLTAMSQE